MTRQVVAVHKIAVSEPGAALEFSGRYDDEGSPIMRKRSRSIPPGALFDLPDGEELLRLLELGAVRLPEPHELAALQ